ncbi:hypothetical protein Tco_0556047 [Tanacetum coccineum]
MALPQRQADVHQDELCKPNKRYALMDANKKIDLDNPLYPNESKIMANIIQNHLLRFSIDASSSVLWIYLGKRIFHLSQATDNNYERFVAAPKFSEMVPFFLNTLSFTLELRLPSNFKTTGLIMQMLYCFVNNIHVDYAEALWEGLHYALEHLSTQIPYPSFTKLIIGHYMTVFPEISRRARNKYHNLEDDVMLKNIFNSWKHKDGVGMKTSCWMITDEMKLMDYYRMYAVVFGVDVPMTQP